MMENKRTRGNLNVMYRLVGLVRPLTPVMVCAVLLGVAGFLCAIFIPVLGVYALLDSLHFSVPVVLKTACILLPILAVSRGVLHYAEQGCNHFIAFKLLALIRDKVFGVLRQLAPAKLEGRDKGDLIAVLTADIELLEVFYAHTISPICIAVIVSVIMACFMGGYAPALGLYAALAYAVIGIGVPVAAAKGARKSGESFRAEFGALNGFETSVTVWLFCREGVAESPCRCGSIAGIYSFCVRRGDEFILSSQMKEAFFRCRYHYFKAAAEILAQIDFDVFAGFSVSCAFHLALAGLNDSYEDRHGIYIYSTETEELVTLERWLRNADLTHPFYIGGAIAYYC